jgi:hypothetical protein
MTLNTIYGLAKEQNKSELCRFMRDMRSAGFKQRVFRDKSSWHRPSVVCKSAHDVESLLKETKVPCETAKKGERFVVYPRQGL